MTLQVVHFIGFAGDEYWSAVKVWGSPHFIHRGYDMRALRDIGPDDLVVFANGAGDGPPRLRSYNDIDERVPVMPGRKTPDPRSIIPALAAALNRAIAENRLPNRYSPDDLEQWSGIPAAAINTIGLKWLGDLIEAMGRDDVDIRYHDRFFSVKERR